MPHPSRTAPRNLPWIILALAGWLTVDPAPAATLQLGPVADTGLIGRSGFQDHNLGNGDTFLAGGAATAEATRSLLRFDLAGQLPIGATITAVELHLTVSRAANGPGSVFGLHKMLKDWNEGAGGGLSGRPALAGETTFNHRLFGAAAWGEPGGQAGVDYTAAASASLSVDRENTYTWASSAKLVEDAQAWLADPSSNFGWMLISENEATSRTARRFHSRESSISPPMLTVTYEPPFKITSVSAEGGAVALQWSGGAPPYQVQISATATGPFANYDLPIESTSTNFTSVDSASFFRIVSEQTARYRVTFEAIWSSATHPQSFPGGAHWSGLVGGTHSAAATFWEVGELASNGIKSMAEFGGKSALLSEVSAAIQAGTAERQLSGAGIGSGSGTSVLEFTVSRDFPLVTLTSMIAPSPDWFIGVGGESLLVDGKWVEEKVVQLSLYDAGTDAGASYASPNQAESPFVPIRRIEGFPALVDNQLTTFGAFTFTRLRD